MHVYVIRNSVTNTEYVGTTVRSVSLRLNDHRCAAFGKEKKSPLYAAMRQYGWQAFAVETIFTTDSYEDLLAREQTEIVNRNTLYPHGYNLVKGGRGNFGWRMSDETRQKISAKAKSRVPWNKGLKASAETRALMSQSRRGHSTNAQNIARRRNGQSIESRRKMSATKREQWKALPASVRERRREVYRKSIAKATLAAHTPEANRKVAEAKRLWWANRTQEQRQRHIEAMRGIA